MTEVGVQVWCFLLLGSGGEPLSVNLSSLELFQPGAVAVSDRGVICLGDPSESQLVFLDQNGGLIRRASRSGQGPGELQGLYSLTWLPERSCFLVFDLSARRVSLWREQGELISTHKVPTAGGLAAFIDETTYCELIDTTGLAGSQPKLVRQDADGRAVLWEGPTLTKSVGLQVKDAHTRMRWDPGAVHALGRDFVAVNDGYDRHITTLRVQGGSSHPPFKTELDQLPFSDEAYEAFLARLNPERRAQFKKYYQKPDHYPLISQLLFDARERIWIIGWRNPKTWKCQVEIRKPDGELMATRDLRYLPKAFDTDGFYTFRNRGDDLYLTKLTFAHR